MFPGALFETPGMTAMTLFVAFIQCVSLSVMAVFLYEYRHIHGKRLDLLRAVDGEHVPHALWERRLLILFYAASTLMLVISSTLLYLFQLHFF
jgi:hypothetical protein